MTVKKKYRWMLLFFLLVITMILSGCGKKEKKCLNEDRPLPDYDGILLLEEKTDRRDGIQVSIPEGMHISGSEDYIFTEDSLQIKLTLAKQSTIKEQIQEISARKEDKKYKDVDIKHMTLHGYAATVMIYNLKDEKSEEIPMLYLTLEFSEQDDVKQEGVIIEVSDTAKKDAYELLDDQRVLAFLQNIYVLSGEGLDSEHPIPSYETEENLKDYEYLAYHVRMKAPEAFDVDFNENEIILQREDGTRISILQAKRNRLEEEDALLLQKTGEKDYYDTGMIQTLYLGYKATVYAYCADEDIADQDTSSIAVVVDYEDTCVADYAGMVIHVTTSDNRYAYDLLKDQDVLAVLNSITVIEGGRLDQENPVPSYDDSLSMTEYESAEKNLRLQIPVGIQTKETEDSVMILTEDGMNITITPVKDKKVLKNSAEEYENGVREEAYIDPDQATLVIADFPASMQIFQEKESASGIIQFQMEYGEHIVGVYEGCLITITRQMPNSPYEWLKDQRILAILHSLTIIEGDDRNYYECNGIATEFPGRYQVTDTIKGDGISACYAASGRPCLTITIAPGTSMIKDLPFDEIGSVYDDLQEITYADQICLWRFEDPKQNKLHVYRPYGKFQTLDITVTLSEDGTRELCETVLSDHDFTVMMEKMTAIPAAEADYVDSDWDEHALDPDEFICEDGVVVGYNGYAKDVVIPEFIDGHLVTSLGAYLFSGSEIESIEIPDQVTEIGEYCFSDCNQLKKVRFSEKLEDIGKSAFENCVQLEDVSLFGNVKYIGNNAFANAGTGEFSCEGKAIYGSEALAGSKFKSVSFGKDSSLSEKRILADNTELVQITLQEGIRELGDEFLINDSSIKVIELPDSMMILGIGAFEGCVNLESVTIPEEIVRIPERCFSDCRKLRLQIPENIQSVGSHALDYVGSDLSQQEQIIALPKGVQLDPEAFHLNYIYLDGIHTPEELPTNFDTCYCDVQVYLCSDTSLSEIKSMDQFLMTLEHYSDCCYFNFAPGTYAMLTLEDLNVSDRTITGLKSDKTEITVGEYLKRDYGEGGDYAPTIVAEKAFAGEDITGLWIGPYIEEIQDKAFADCTTLREIWVLGSVSQVSMGEDVFTGIPEDAVIHIPGRFTEKAKEQLRLKFCKAGVSEKATFDFYTCTQGQ